MSKQDETKQIHAMSDAELSRNLLHAIWRVQDAGGVSGGRSWESRMLEAAMALVDAEASQREKLSFNHELLLEEAERRNRITSKKRLDEHFAELDRLTRPK